MPFSSNADLPKGVKSLPEGQQTKWRKVFNAAYEGTCKDRGDKRDECAEKIAWSQIDDKYKGKSVLVSFSMAIRSATHDKQKDTLRWKATASDTDEDFYHDNMSLELFNDFTSRIAIKELVPEDFRSAFWSGGEPYLSISHYPDLEGAAVPGLSEKTYIDGNQLKSVGQFNKTPLGLACYHAICKDLYTEPKSENPIRISIAFLDWGHVHKSNGYEFERECIDDICLECVSEHIKGEFSGKIFKKGQLVHLALTRVPANERTSMEVDRSMTTRKEDAVSIIGDELADELDEKAKLVQKSVIGETSNMLVVKTDEETEPVPEPIVEEAKPKSKEEEAEKDEGSEEESDKDHKKKKSLVDERLDKIEQILSSDNKSEHELDKPFSNFKSAFDEIKKSPISSDEKLMQLQEFFNELGNVVKSRIQSVPEPIVEQSNATNGNLAQEIAVALAETMRPLYEKMDLLLTKQSEPVVKSIPATPVRRSIAPTLSMQNDIRQVKQIETPGQSSALTQMIRKSVGLPQ